jgi:hypothetical protein
MWNMICLNRVIELFFLHGYMELTYNLVFWGSRDAGGIVTGYTGWTARARFSAVQDFSLLHSVQTGSGAHSTSYSVGNGGSFPGAKRQGRESDHSPPSNAQAKPN